jgi:signal transduction histidine kinase
MNFKNSIQRRVFMTFAGFTLLLSVLYWGINVLIAYVVEDKILEKILLQETQHLEQMVSEKGIAAAKPRLDYIKLYRSIEQAPLVIQAALEKQPGITEVFVNKQTHYHIQYVTFNEKYDALVVAEVGKLLTVANVSMSIIIMFFAIFLITLAIAIWFAYRLALRTTRPITTLALQVEQQHLARIDPGTSTSVSTPASNSTKDDVEPPPDAFKLSGTEQKDELGFLASTLQNTLRELNESVKRERDFNRDISHELRTPLTVLNNTLALASQRSLNSDDLKQLNDSTESMNQLVTTLLALARAETIKREPINLCAVLEQCVINLQHKMVEPAFEVTLDIPQHVFVNGNQQLFILLVNNLVENAIAHATDNRLVIRYDDAIAETSALIFENNIAQPLQENITHAQIKSESSQGIGQGLYLVSRISEALNWTFNIDSELGKFRFILKMD